MCLWSNRKPPPRFERAYSCLIAYLIVASARIKAPQISLRKISLKKLSKTNEINIAVFYHYLTRLKQVDYDFLNQFAINRV